MRPHRGISEIVASLIVLIIVSVMGVMLYNLSMENLTIQQSNFSLDIKVRESIAQERFEVVDVKYVDNELIIYFLNYGKTDVRISDVYLEDVNNVVTRYEYDQFTPSDYLLVHEGKLLTSDCTFIKKGGLDVANLISCKLVSRIGVSDEYAFKFS